MLVYYNYLISKTWGKLYGALPAEFRVVVAVVAVVAAGPEGEGIIESQRD